MKCCLKKFSNCLIIKLIPFLCLLIVHLDGHLFEYGEKGGFVCKLHENMDIQRSAVEDEKDYSDNDIETDKEYSSTDSNSPLIIMEKSMPREPSPRVSIVEVSRNFIATEI